MISVADQLRASGRCASSVGFLPEIILSSSSGVRSRRLSRAVIGSCRYWSEAGINVSPLCPEPTDRRRRGRYRRRDSFSVSPLRSYAVLRVHR